MSTQTSIDFDADAAVESRAALPPMEPGVIYIDTSVGSRELAPIFQRQHGRKISLQKLPSADFAFTCGHTIKNPFCKGDYGCRIGFERKTLSDLVGSLLKARLDGQQVPFMLRGYTMSYVTVEGRWRSGPNDSIEQVVWQTMKDAKPDGSRIEICSWKVSKLPLTYSQLEGWLARYEVGAYGRIQIARGLIGMEGTAAFVASKHQWWMKDWNKHHFGAITKMPEPVRALMFTANEYQKVIASLPGVGLVNMRKVYGYFGSIIGIMHATPKELQRAGLGKKRAMELYHMIRREWR